MDRTVWHISVAGLTVVATVAVLRIPAKRSPAEPPSPMGITTPSRPTDDPRLSATMPAHDFKDVRLDAVLAWIAWNSPLPVDVQWPLLNKIDGVPAKLLTLQFPAGTLQSSLDAALFDDDFGGNLAWRLEDGRIVFTTAADDQTLRRYDIGTLRAPAGFAKQPATDFDPWQSLDWIVKKITAVDSPTWQANGGNCGTVTYIRNGLVLVRCRSRTQIKVQSLLYQLERGS
jgi:hypothetical protein